MAIENDGPGHGFASLAEVLELLQSVALPGQSPESQKGTGPDYPYEAHDTINRESFYPWFAKDKKHIAQGDVYQIQLGHEIQVNSGTPPFQVYQWLHLQDPFSYSITL